MRRKRPPSPFRGASEVAKKRLGLAGVVHLQAAAMCVSPGRASISAGGPRCCAPCVSGSVEWPRRVEGRADCLGESLRAVDDEEVRHSGIEAAFDEIADQRLHGRRVFRCTSTTPSGCLSPFTSTPIAATRVMFLVHVNCRHLDDHQPRPERSDAIHSFSRAADSATKRLEAADFDRQSFGAGTRLQASASNVGTCASRR